MATTFSAAREVEEIRSRIDHPIVDADGHYLQFMPLVHDIMADLAGPSVVDALRRYDLSAGHVRTRGYWGWPEEETLDRMTAVLPELLYRRMDEIGLDFAVLYPSPSRLNMHPDAEVRQAGCRALNIYAAEVYGPYKDRVAPAALIPMHTPEEAMAELEFAVGQLGLKATMMEGGIPRAVREDGTQVPWIDTLGHGSAYSYDPVWQRCLELRVVPAFHGVAFGWGSRVSSTNYVHNHIGAFSTAQEGVCRGLVMGGVPKRFPELRFAFLEGGVGWGFDLYAGLLGHYEKRNKDAVRRYDPSRFDLEAGLALFEEFATGRLAERKEQFAAAAAAAASSPPDPRGYDDFAESLITSPEDLADMFSRQFSFGCEADDHLAPLAFARHLLPGGIRLNALFSSDIGHWDVPRMAGVLPEAWELVEDGLLGEDEFRDLTFGNVHRMLTAMNPDFFTGTVIGPPPPDQR